jgi:hypothetical protein
VLGHQPGQITETSRSGRDSVFFYCGVTAQPLGPTVGHISLFPFVRKDRTFASVTLFVVRCQVY